MRLLAAILFLASVCHGQTVGTCWGNDIGGTGTTATISVSPTGGSGHLLVAAARNGTSTAGAMAFSDNSGSNSWTTNTVISVGTIASQSVQGFSMNPIAGTYTVTMTAHSAGNRSIYVCELSGMATSAVLDTEITTMCTSATNCTSNMFTTHGNDVIFVSTTTNAGTPPYKAGAIGANTGSLVTTHDSDGGETTQFTTAQTNITANIALTTGSVIWALSVGAYKVATAASGHCAACDLSQLWPQWMNAILKRYAMHQLAPTSGTTTTATATQSSGGWGVGLVVVKP